jgi:hypothetical protein
MKFTKMHVTHIICYIENVRENIYTLKINTIVGTLTLENRNDPDLVQAFLKKWWVESDFKAPNLPVSLRFKGSGCHYNSI